MSTEKLRCKNCAKYWALRKPTASGKSVVELHRGYCLAKSKFAGNRPGTNEYPPGAKIMDLPYGQHNLVIVREDEIKLGCTDAERIK